MHTSSTFFNLRCMTCSQNNNDVNSIQVSCVILYFSMKKNKFSYCDISKKVFSSSLLSYPWCWFSYYAHLCNGKFSYKGKVINLNCVRQRNHKIVLFFVFYSLRKACCHTDIIKYVCRSHFLFFFIFNTIITQNIVLQTFSYFLLLSWLY